MLSVDGVNAFNELLCPEMLDRPHLSMLGDQRIGGAFDWDDDIEQVRETASLFAMKSPA